MPRPMPPFGRPIPRTALFAALLWMGLVAPAVPQTAAPGNIETVDVPLAVWLASRDHAPPDTLPDFAVSEARLADFREFADELAAADWTKARQLAGPLRYQLVAIRERNDWFVVASDNSGQGRDPTLVINASPRSDLVVEAPHEPFEPGTAEQAAVLLSELGGRAAIVSGAHRCASKSFTSCDGRTAVCGSLEGYRDSDPAHNTGTLFHAAHLAFSERWRSAVFISLHGMKEDTKGVRTSLIISNGARGEDRDAQTVATKLRLALERPMGEPGRVVSCNLPADAAYKYRALCGFTNVQGREINGDADACRGSVDNGTGRFIHLEQDWSILRPYARARTRIDQQPSSKAFIDALAPLLPPVPVR
ncbi:MAG: hypothetical protein AB7S93_00140 [Xanthobacteraceae bacterium]